MKHSIKLQCFVFVNKLIYRLAVFFDGIVIIGRYSTMRKFWNLLRVLYHRMKKDARLNSYPCRALIETTNYCNLSCLYCPHGTNTILREQKHLGWEDFCKIIDDLAPYLYLVLPFLHGEPFLTPGFIRMVEYLHHKNISCQVSTNLNVKLREEDVQKLIDSQLMTLLVSVDAASQETYEKYRVGGDFVRVLENIHLINVVKKKNKSRYPILVWQFLVFNYNEDHILPAYNMAKSLNMRFKLLSPNCHDKVRSGLAPDGSPPVQEVFCSFPWSTVFVHSNRDVSICCMGNNAVYKMGSFPDDNFLEFWNNDKFIRARNIVAGRQVGRDSLLAKLCVRCKMNNTLDIRNNTEGEL